MPTKSDWPRFAVEPAAASGAAPTTHRRRREKHSRWPLRLLVIAVLLLAAESGYLAVEWGKITRPRSSSALPTPASNLDLGRIIDPGTLIADPDVLTGPKVDYLYSSESNFTPPYIPVRTFTVFGKWGKPLDAMPQLPVWANSWVWNPNVRFVRGRYVMWFTATWKAVALSTGAPPRCLGWATSSSPLGPFVPASGPAICQVNRFGAIDPDTLVAPTGQEWLYWKSDSNAVPAAHMPTVIWAQKLAANGITREGKAVEILSNTQPWEGTVVEAPQMVFARGHYYLFFSGNVSGTTLNGIGMVTCRGPAGPCDNDAYGPWLGTSPQTRAVGEEYLFNSNDKTWLLYSPHRLFQVLMISRVAFGPNGPYVASFHHLPSTG